MSNLSKLRQAVLAVVASMAVVLSGAMPASATTPTVSTPPTLSLADDILTIGYPVWGELPGHTAETQIAACSEPQQQVVVPTSSPAINFGACVNMSTTQGNGMITATTLDLNNLYINISGTWIDFLASGELNGHSYSHIVIGSSYVDFSVLSMWSIRPASVQFGQLSSPTSPTVDVLPSINSLSGTSVNLTLSEWSNVNAGPFHLLFACPAPVTEDFSLTLRGSSLPSTLASCNSLGQISTPSVDLIDAPIPASHTHIVLVATSTQSGTSDPWWIYTDSFNLVDDEDTSSTSDVLRATPYTGPVLNTPAITNSIPAGAKVVIPGSNLAGVSSVEIGGVKATVVVNSDGELEIVVPAGLAAGTYDLVVTSDSGVLTVQGAITVSEPSITSTSGSAIPSTKRMGDGTAKVWVFDVVGAGKVQIFVNGKEIAWVNATDASDPKLFNGYLVRTVELAEGKNVIEVFVDGERERRTVYSN